MCRVLKFCAILSSNFLLVCACRKMNTRRNTYKKVGEAVARGNQALPQAPAAGLQVHVNPAALTDVEVRAALFQMAKPSLLSLHYNSPSNYRVCF